jgi:hypothetical protein
MRTRELAATVVVALGAAACVTRTHEENAARRSTWPTGASAPTAVANRTDTDWPTVKGDILRGTSPEELAKARAMVSQPLAEALAKP